MSDSPTRTIPAGYSPADEPTSGAVRDGNPTAVPETAKTDAMPPVAPAGYELLEEIGRGGMGVVYRARELALNRNVAIKLLRDRYQFDGAAAKRFSEEAQITGQLQHPGIPPVHQIGTLPDGRPFLAMKLIKGSTLENLLKEREDPGEDRGRFLAVFEQVCQAVGYAHAHRVIHRDLKPANVMVGAFGEVQVMDWGLAKALSDAPLDPAELPMADEDTLATEIRSVRDVDSATQAGSVLGTPAFMPPEQAGGEIEKIDERSDVFGLGAVLCVILTGRPPYEGKDAESVRLMAIRGQLAPAFTRLAKCKAEPDLIALAKRCLSADPAERPRNAGEVAKAVAELRSAAEDRAKQAELERARAEVHAVEQRKRRRVQAALGLMFTTGVVLAGVGLWWADRQKSERKLEQERAAAEQARIENEQKMEQLAAGKLVEDELGRTLAALAVNDLPAARVAFDKAQALLSRSGSAELRARLQQLREDLDVIRDAEQIRIEAADVYEKPDREQLLALHRQRMFDLFRRYGVDANRRDVATTVAGLKPRPAVIQLAEWLDYLALLLPQTDEHAATRRYLLDVCAAVDSDPWRARNRAAVREWDVNAMKDLARSADDTVSAVNLSRLAINLASARAYPEAEEVFRRAVRLYPNDFWINLNYANFLGYTVKPARFPEAARRGIVAVAIRPGSAYARFFVGNLLRQSRDEVEAEAMYLEGLRLSPDSVWGRNQLGSLLHYLGRNQEAVHELQRAIELDPHYVWAYGELSESFWSMRDIQNARKYFQTLAAAQPKNAYARGELAWFLWKTGDHRAAVAQAREAVEIDPQYRRGHSILCVAYTSLRELDEAEASGREAIRLHPTAAIPRLDLGHVFVARGDLNRAREAMQDAVRVDPCGVAYSELAWILWQMRDYSAAEAAAREGIRIAPRHARSHQMLALALRDRDDLGGAETAGREAIRLDPKSPFMRIDLSTVLRAKGDYNGAVAECEAAIKLDPKYSFGYYHLGLACRGKNDLERAIEAFQQSIALNPDHLFSHYQLGLALKENDDTDGAIAAYKKCIEINPKYAPAHNNLGVIRFQKKDWDAAIVCFREALKFDPGSAMYQKNLDVALKQKSLQDGRIAPPPREVKRP